MKIIEEKYNRYGEKDYDTSYIGWGFDDLETQIRMAEKMQKLFPSGARAILDIACGISRYHQFWLKSGYAVTGTDLSETFIEYSRNYNEAFEKANYFVCDCNHLDLDHQYDIAVWTDPVELTGLSANRIFKALKPGGIFIYEMWNDNYYKYHSDDRHNDCQTWTCKDGVYRLVRHKYNRATCVSEHEEIIFDVPNDTMIHKTGLAAKNINSHCSIQILEAAGFKNIRFVDYEGEPFSTESQQVQRFFMIGEK
ncbi:class I SAM-dependent methyltransferase [Paenibacillus sp. 7124]|uniref:Class I SAM-dependent methyltransferase n=1 Tax=Paenibacillus apii TaxID=1850370 RepID=A0A6M1PKG0_9BACL|nr:class I SAM-dependent methyltransferase [Paenibacillus apii]NGM82785.1 class I SAM-dependent methyltransferase [Paenibacillus apii]NJJ39925.1 class I SAM-dependent methyltransferase [Paenibacillus apii]